MDSSRTGVEAADHLEAAQVSAARRPVGIGLYFPDFVWPRSGRMEPIDRIRECLLRCERYGFDVWVPERLVDTPGMDRGSRLDPLIFLSYAAALTKTVAIGTQILLAPLHEPILAAKQIATLQELSGGRFQLGIGTGWHPAEYAAVGVPMRERGRRTDELIDALEILLTEESATYHGRHYEFEDIAINPRVGMPPMWCAGGSRRQDTTTNDPAEIHPNVLRRIIRSGNWMSRNATTPDLIERDWREIRRFASESGVDPSSITFGHVNWFHITDATTHAEAITRQVEPFTRQMGSARDWAVVEECYLTGTVDEMVDRLNQLIEYGCTYFCLGPTSADPTQIELLESEIAPRLRGRVES